MDLHKDRTHIPDYSTSPSYPPYTPYYPISKKRKWAAGMLSFMLPGTGHFYLGLMQRGLFIMMLLILDIFTITALVDHHNASVPTVTLFALFLPVIYFYNLFDVLQLTDHVNRRLELGEFAVNTNDMDIHDPLQKLMKGTNMGVILIIAGGLIFMLSNKPNWFSVLFNLMGSFFGSCILVLAGVAMFILDRKNK
ncbi:hypothetical protein A8709_10930 [Paenibacillus pectinilyticus]|uniref:Uncharacterized protein n=1 Tax=Paenibacillus pectinilyticus TaxID=512399 RepID=A0A1C1A2D5_9BACL|nr:DUF6677 family protein [Paenibacillus pectinilyticus]OCT14687.1 hypothetical protein A8709_10930 [Paenibacillus pectinilyticus]